MTTNTKLCLLDLNSGTGIFSHTLRTVAITKQYYEPTLAGQKILQNNINLGRLDQAPIACAFDEISLATNYDLVTISFRHPQEHSKFYFSKDSYQKKTFDAFLAILENFQTKKQPISFALIECNLLWPSNYCIIVSKLDSVGYSTVWLTLDAKDIGAPHKRSCWICLAVHNTADIHKLSTFPMETFNFAETTRPRLIPIYPSPDNITPNSLEMEIETRQAIFNSAVMPQVICVGYNTLVFVIRELFLIKQKSRVNYEKERQNLNIEKVDGDSFQHLALLAESSSKQIENGCFLTEPKAKLYEKQQYYPLNFYIQNLLQKVYSSYDKPTARWVGPLKFNLSGLNKNYECSLWLTPTLVNIPKYKEDEILKK